MFPHLRTIISCHIAERRFIIALERTSSLDYQYRVLDFDGVDSNMKSNDLLKVTKPSKDDTFATNGEALKAYLRRQDDFLYRDDKKSPLDRFMEGAI